MALGVPRRPWPCVPCWSACRWRCSARSPGSSSASSSGGRCADLLESLLPLPVYRTPFQIGRLRHGPPRSVSRYRCRERDPRLACGARRADHGDPHRAPDRARQPPDRLDRPLRLPGSSLTLMPLRNLLRTPRRTMLTAVSVGAAITALVAVLGMLDSFGRTIDRAGAEFTKGDADRVLVQLDTFPRSTRRRSRRSATLRRWGRSTRACGFRPPRSGGRGRGPRPAPRPHRPGPRGLDTDDRGRPAPTSAAHRARARAEGRR